VIARSLLVVFLLALGAWAPQQDSAASRYAPPADGALATFLPDRPPVPHAHPTARVLRVVWHHQEHNLSCEAAALRMALSFVGVQAGEMTLMALTGYDERPAVFDAKGRLVEWGDPNAAYVGNPDGHIERYTGYGVYFGPVARAANAAGARVIAAGSGLYGSGIGPQAIYAAVLAGHPVVAWISNTYHRVPLSSYTAYDGKRVYFTLTEHAVTIVGVRPGAVLINDPWFGPAWHSKAQFESAYSTFGDMAVIIGA